MKHGLGFRVAAALLFFGLLAFSSCGGGSTPDPGPGGQTGNGSNNVPIIDFDGPEQYGGQDKPTPPDNTGGDPGSTTPDNAPFVYGNIFAVPITSNGQGRVVATTISADGTGRLGFLPGQKVAIVMVNTNPDFLDAHYDTAAQSFPQLPDSAFSVSADLVSRGASSMAGWNEIQQATTDALGRSDAYNGLRSDVGTTVSPSLLYERESLAQGNTPYSVAPVVKAVSSIQKGEIRTFLNVTPTIPPPAVLPDPDNEERDVTEFQYPYEYRASQDGRLVAIGAHCLVFLSTEINNGNPDSIRFTEARLNGLAQEFDTRIFPTTQAAFASIDNYDEGNIMRDLNRSIILDGADFDNTGALIDDLPGTVDINIAKEQRMVIFLFNSIGGGGGFYTGGLSAAAQQALIDEGRQDDIARLQQAGSTLYIDLNNLPANDNAWSSAYSVMAHEFQHKLYHDNDLPERIVDPADSNFLWFNEGMSQMSIHVNGYSVNSGQIIPWAINGQLTDYLGSVNTTPIPCDGNAGLSNQPQYGGGFLFFLYLYEHYDAGVGQRIYAASKAGESSFIKLIEAGARQTYFTAGPDAVLGTADDVQKSFHDSFTEVYTKFALANFIDGIYAANDNDLFDPRFHYNTIDLKGTVNLANGTLIMPGVRTGVYPTNGSYPVLDIHRICRPWCCDYMVFTNGDSSAADVRDLSITVYTDPNMKMFMLPTNYNAVQNAAAIVEGVTIPTS